MEKPSCQMASKIVAATLGLGFLFAVLFGAQTEAWSWGPALLLIGMATAMVVTMSDRRVPSSFVGISLSLALAWVICRALQSPVVDAARADGLLALALGSCAWITSRLLDGGAAIRYLYVCLACSALGNVVLALAQYQQPDLVWPYANKPTPNPTGFFGHYNYFSNFVGGVGVLCLCRAAFAKDGMILKILFLATFLGALTTVPLSGSRGGAIGLGFGSFLFLCAAGTLAWRSRSRLTGVFLVAMPVLLIGACAGGWLLLKDVQARKSAGIAQQSVVGMADNLARLQWLRLVHATALEHPIEGGGSRSFSWERNRKWDVDLMGRGAENEPFVHNELGQAATDYGLVGASLIVLAIGAMMWSSVVRLFLGGVDEGGGADANAAAVISAGGGMLVQSNLSFVFHLLPSAMLLGVLFGLTPKSGKYRDEDGSSGWWSRFQAVLIALPLLGFGLAGTRTLHTIWPVLYGDRDLMRMSADEEMQCLTAASRWWPGYRLEEERGRVARMEAVGKSEHAEAFSYWNTEAATAFKAATIAHPFHPGFQVNLGNILSELQRDEEAEEAFRRAIELQGGLESAFRVRLCYARHLYRRWYQIWQDERRAEEALHEFLRARDLLDQSDDQSLWGYEDSRALRANLDKVIGFLEGAQVVPVPPEPR